MFTRTESFSQFVKLYPAITLLTAINILVFLLTSLPIFPADTLFRLLTGVNLYISNGEWWRLVSPIFVHGSFTHLLFNSFSLIIFGPALERMLHKNRFLIFFIATGILANLATYFLKPLTYTHVGASGAIFGILGFYLYLALFKKSWFSRQNSQTILTMIVLGVIMTFVQPQINIIGHLAGLAAGFLLTKAFIRNQ